jgi:hemoglobin
MEETHVPLYDRLGGIFSIAALVNHFSDAVLENDLVGKNSPNPQLRRWSREQSDERLPGLKFMRTLWVAAVTGGPFTFAATHPGRAYLSLESAHKQFMISPEEFDAVAGELAASLAYFNVPAQETQEVLGAFAAHKGEVTEGWPGTLEGWPGEDV